MSTRLTTAEFAELAGISNRKARAAFGRALAGKTWRGVRLVVEPLVGRGGVAGQSYLVRTDSMPADLQQRLNNRLAIVERPVLLNATDDRDAKNRWRHLILSPALANPPRSIQRVAEIDAILSRPLTDWNGRAVTLSRRTVERWLTAYERQGVAAFVPKARADRGARKVIISLTAEQAINLPTDAWEKIAIELRKYVNAHWKAGETLKMIRGNADFRFRELLELAGVDCKAVSERTFIVPRRFIEAERRPLNVLAMFKRDRKTYEDNRFRTRRSRAGLQPMDWVIADVHPIDIAMQRPDGSVAHARLIGWLDYATSRLRFDLLLCEPGTGIRNADLICSFVRMIADPTWGMPKTLYIDNGREYRFAENLNDAMQLVAQLRGQDGRGARVVHAKPYNASAKPIESMFAHLERMLQGVPGHTGGDRLNKKTERVGRPTAPFPGTIAELGAIVQGVVTRMETLPMGGQMKGRSPRQVYEAALSSGWQPVAVDPTEILTVFADNKECRVRQQTIRHDNRVWHCEALGTSYFGNKVIARIPRFWSAERLALLDPKSLKLVGLATPEPAFAFDDPAGSRRSSEIDKRTRAALRVIDKNTPAIDTTAEMMRIAAKTPPARIAQPIATVGISDQAKEISAALVETPQHRRDRRQDQAEQEHRARLAMFEGALKKSGDRK